MSNDAMPAADRMATRAELVDRFCAVRPLLDRRLVTRVMPPELQAGLQSVTLHQLEALGRLFPDGLTMGALARALGITDGSAAVLSDRLVKQGLAVRKPDAKDRRVVWLEPSEHAALLLRRFRAIERQVAETSLRVLSDAELATLLSLVEKVAAGLPCKECGGS